MAGQHTEIALGARHHNHIGVLGKHQFGWGDQFEIDFSCARFGHGPGFSLRRLSSYFLCFFNGFLDGANHVEGTFG